MPRPPCGKFPIQQFIEKHPRGPMKEQPGLDTYSYQHPPHPTKYLFTPTQAKQSSNQPTAGPQSQRPSHLATSVTKTAIIKKPNHVQTNPLNPIKDPRRPFTMDMLTQAEQRTLEQRMQKRQVKEFMGAFGGLVEHCFTSCVDDFTSKAVSSRESGCINRCVLKWMATQQRVSDRFQEHNAQLTLQMQNK